MTHKHLCIECETVLDEGDFDCEIDADHDFAMCDECEARLFPARGMLDVPVKFACGCEETWHDGDTLFAGVYAYCEEHGDTEVFAIH